MVGAKGFEPSTSWSRTRRASQAALRPDKMQRHANASPQGTLEYHSTSHSATVQFAAPTLREAAIACLHAKLHARCRRTHTSRRHLAIYVRFLEAIPQRKLHYARPVQGVGVVSKAAGNINLRQGAEGVETH